MTIKMKMAIICSAIFAATASDFAFANAGTLLNCKGVSTAQGYQYVGTYCLDYECQFVVRRTFNDFCPYLLASE
jgi:hypothetical protein